MAERIQNLGGIPTDDVGMMRNMAQIMIDLKSTTKNDRSILKDAIVGEQRGIKKSKSLLDGDLDPESLQIVHDILDHDEEHVELLNKFLH